MTEPDDHTADPLAPLVAAGILGEPVRPQRAPHRDEPLESLSEDLGVVADPAAPEIPDQQPAAPEPPYGEIHGTPVDETQVAAWADEAESGYDLPAAPEGFVRGNERLTRLLDDPDRGARVAAIRTQMDAADQDAHAEED